MSFGHYLVQGGVIQVVHVLCHLYLAGGDTSLYAGCGATGNDVNGLNLRVCHCRTENPVAGGTAGAEQDDGTRPAVIDWRLLGGIEWLQGDVDTEQVEQYEERRYDLEERNGGCSQ